MTPTARSRRTTRPRTAALLATTVAVALAACGSAGSSDEEAAAAAPSPGTDAAAGAASDGDATTGDQAGAYPVTLTSCGAEVTFESAPERVVLLKSASVPYLAELDVLDRVVARAGVYPEEYYDEQTLADLDAIPLLTDQTDTAGHLQISQEVVLDQTPDLVMGEVDNLDRASLQALDVPQLEEPALCSSSGEGAPDASFDMLYDQFAAYGQVFDRPEQAQAAADALRARVEELTAAAPGDGRTAAVLYPTVGGGTTYAYGTGSMAHPQLEAAGFENVFADVEERVFEVTLEELVGRDPDVLVLLHSEGDPAEVQQAVTSLPGADGITAVREDEVLVQLFNFTEPPTPLAVDGLQRINERFGG